MWLTVNLPDLCISVYTYLPVPPLAPARPHASVRICASIGALCVCSASYVCHMCVMRGKTLGFLRVLDNVSTVMVSVAIEKLL